MTTTKQRRSLALGIAGMLLFAACSGDASDTSAESSGDSAVSGSIRVWTHQNNAFNASLEALAADFTAANPEVDISFETFDYDTYVQTLQTSLPAGTEADVLQLFGTWTCSYADNLSPVPEAVSTLAAAQDRYFSAAIDGYTCNDQLYGFPMESNIEYGAGLFNRAIASEAGVDLDAGWASWDDLIADAVKMTEGEPGAMTRAGFHFLTADGITSTFLANILQQGGDYLNADGTAFTFETPEAAASLALMQQIVDAGAVDPVTYGGETNWIGDCFFEENCAGGLVGPWVLGDYKEDFPGIAAQAQFVKLPLFDGATEPKYVADSGWGLAVSKNTENAAAAWAFVDFVTQNDENALRWNTEAGTIPAVKANVEGGAGEELVAKFPQFGPFIEVLPFGRYVGAIPDRDLVYYDILYPEILKVLQGISTPEEALATMTRDATASLQ